MGAAGKRVLLVEDELNIRILVSSILRTKGYETVLAENGLQALDALNSQPAFDLIITDLQMPGLSGVDLLRELRKTQPNLPIVVISAYTAADWALDVRENATITLPKPFSHGQLVSVVESIA